MDHLDTGFVGLERSLMVKTKTLDRLTKELAEAGKKMKDDSVDAQKKTFLKAQIPKMEKEVTELKKKVGDLLESEELDPRGEFYLLAQTLV